MKRGFTVIELVVSIAIAGLLGALLLAALNSARESARATYCRNNLLQLSSAIHSFESRKKIFPSAGWTFFWVSLSDRGTGENQPGSWIFNILPDLEHTQLANGSPSSMDLAADRSELFRGFARLSIATVRCPSKRNRDSNRVRDVSMMFGGLEYCSHSDYAMNAGSAPDEFYSWPGPSSLAESERFEWPSRKFDGVGRSRYAIRHAEIRDGASQTICLGEKRIYRWVDTKEDNQPIWTGFGADTCRWFLFKPLHDDADGGTNGFGGPHSRMTNFAFCDGSVRAVNNELDEVLFQQLGTIDGSEIVIWLND